MKLTAKDGVSTLVTLLVGVPLVVLFSGAVIEGETRRREVPLRAMLGDESYDALVHGHTPEQGYFGNNRTAPNFTLTDQHGQPWRLADHRGKVVVMNFWSITCPPCVDEMPALVSLAEAFAGRDDVEVVSVTTDANWDAVSSLFARDAQLRVLFDADKRVTQGLYGTRMLPETWIIDGEGVIRARIDGARDWSTPMAKEMILSFAL